MPALNEHAFAHGPPIEATAGMWTIQRVHLALGQRIYRFGSSTSPDLWYAGAWWLRYEDYLKIRRSAETGETSLGYAARRFLALRYEWGGNVDVLVSGIVSPPLDAYAGRGRVQDRFSPKPPPPGAFEWHPPADVMQLYVPGLGDHLPKGGRVERSAISRQAIQFERHESIPSHVFR
jgi:hypothetical protein